MNPNVAMTLDECVAEVFGMLTGLDLQYAPEQDRYQSVVRQLNRALRAHALETDWSYYSDVEDIGTAHTGDREVAMRATIRPRIINDDAVRLVDADGTPRVWAYFLPRDADHKYIDRQGLWVSHTRSSLRFSRPFHAGEDGLTIQVPVMREPKMFRLPDQPEDPEEPLVTVPATIREQLLDYDYPDVVLLRAAYYYAQTDPVMQPRVQTLEAQFKDLMYQLIERDEKNTDSPFLNEFLVPVQNGISHTGHRTTHPLSDERR